MLRALAAHLRFWCRGSLELNEKQAKFCREYLIDLNACQAAIRAGYSAKTARQIGCRLLTQVNVEAEIRQLRAQACEKSGVTHAKVLKELARIAFSDARNVMSWGPDGVKLLPSDSLSNDVAATVSEASETISKDGGSIKLKLHDKLAALDKIARHLGMYVDKTEITGKGGAELIIEVTHIGRK
jgi:phage terminase small subunit